MFGVVSGSMSGALSGRGSGTIGGSGRGGQPLWPAEEPGCEWLFDGAGAPLLQLPDFPEISTRFKLAPFWLPPIPRLLPSAEQLLSLNSPRLSRSVAPQEGAHADAVAHRGGGGGGGGLKPR